MSESKEAICEALRACMERQPLASISVQGVCDKAGLSRKTFSRNFSDLQDVVVYQVFLDFIQPICELKSIMGDFMVDTPTTFNRNLHVLRQNKAYYDDVAATYGMLWLTEQIAQAALQLDYDPYEHHHFTPTERSFVEHFYVHAVASVYRWWMEEGMETPEEDVARMTDRWLYARFDNLEDDARP